MLKLTALTVLPMLLASCAQDRLMTPMTATGHKPAVCSQWQDISYASKHDTQATIDAVRRQNAARDAYCTN